MVDPDAVRKGRKILTEDNFLDADESSSLLVWLNTRTGRAVSPTARDWARSFLSISLQADVPDEVSTLFDAARGALVYGYFYYPVYALAEDQLFRVVDAAVLHRYRLAGGQMGRRRVHTPGEAEPVERVEAPPFEARLTFLSRRSVVDQMDVDWWRVMWDLRNITSHPTVSRLGPQSDALRTLRDVASHINELFAPMPND